MNWLSIASICAGLGLLLSACTPFGEGLLAESGMESALTAEGSQGEFTGTSETSATQTASGNSTTDSRGNSGEADVATGELEGEDPGEDDGGNEASEATTSGGNDEHDGGDELEGAEASDTDTASDSSNESDDDGCSQQHELIEYQVPQLMMLVDQSGSMSRSSWRDHGSTRTLWYSLRRVIKSVLADHIEAVDIGIKLFPAPGSKNNSDEGCSVDPGVEVAPGTADLDGVLSVLPSSDTKVMGMTPTRSAIDEVLGHFQQNSSLPARDILLFIDGETNCEQSAQEVEARVSAARSEDDIVTHVIGLDLEADIANQMEAVARAGGTPGLRAARSGDELEDQVRELLDGLLRCPMQFRPAEQGLPNVDIDGQPVPYIGDYSDCASAIANGANEGWLYRNASAGRAELCGASCAAFAQFGTVDLLYTCDGA